MKARKIKFGSSVLKVLVIQVSAMFGIMALAFGSFVGSVHFVIDGQPINPLVPVAIVVILGFPFVLFILPRFIRLTCPKCRKKALRYDLVVSLSFRCTRCGIEKYTWIRIGGG